jgi:hypothetical protein
VIIAQGHGARVTDAFEHSRESAKKRREEEWDKVECHQ